MLAARVARHLDVRAAVVDGVHLHAATEPARAELLEPALEQVLGLELRQREHDAGACERHGPEHATLACDASTHDRGGSAAHLVVESDEGERTQAGRMDADRTRAARPARAPLEHDRVDAASGEEASEQQAHRTAADDHDIVTRVGLSAG